MNYPTNQQPSWAQQPQKKSVWGRRRVLLPLTAAVFVVIGAAIGGSSSDSSSVPVKTIYVTVTPVAPAPGGHAPTQAPTTAAAKPSALAASIAGDGTFRVGTDVAPGTYRSTGNTLCYWERDKDLSGSLDSIIANDNPNGTAMVTLNRGEYFKSQGCSSWTKVG